MYKTKTHNQSNCDSAQEFEAPPFPVLLRLLFEPLLALFVLQGNKVPVVVNQEILGDIIRIDLVGHVMLD